MTVQRETYSELLHSMLYAYVQGQLSGPQVASVMFACAQPTTTEDTTDITHEVRDRLTDWPELDKGMLIAIETVKMTFQCVNIHGPCEKGHHTVNMTRVIGSMDWEPELVPSQHDFSEVIVDITVGSREGKKVVGPRSKGGPHDLIQAFRKIFDENPPDKIEREVKDFRAELDALFPSTPSTPTEKGGTDDST